MGVGQRENTMKAAVEQERRTNMMNLLVLVEMGGNEDKDGEETRASESGAWERATRA